MCSSLSLSTVRLNITAGSLFSSNCEILPLEFMRNKLAVFGVKMNKMGSKRNDKKIFDKLDIFERTFTIENRDFCANKDLKSLCPSQRVIKSYPGHFPEHSTENECLCNNCSSLMPDAGCKPVYKLQPVLILNKKSCKWIETMRPRVVG